MEINSQFTLVYRLERWNSHDDGRDEVKISGQTKDTFLLSADSQKRDCKKSSFLSKYQKN